MKNIPKYGSVIVIGLCIAGCPVSGEVEEPDANATYWVQEFGGRLSYFEFPSRGNTGRWRLVGDPDTSWYQGPGAYEFTIETGWKYDESTGSISLDDMLQTYDPIPRP